MTSSLSTSTLVRHYDVFLSFRGKDTRQTFVSHLYEALRLKRLHTFKDDERIELGDNICHRLLEAIHTSWFAIVIISVNHATSSWCLEELRTIMELHKEGKIQVVPIFLGVEPSDVRKQTGRFGIAFENYKAPEMKEKVLKWREALVQVSDLAGIHSSQCVDEAAMIAKVVGRISTQLRVIKPTKKIDFAALKAHMKQVDQPTQKIDFEALKAHMKQVDQPTQKIDFEALKAHMNRVDPLLEAHMKRKNPMFEAHMNEAKTKRPKRVDGYTG